MRFKLFGKIYDTKLTEEKKKELEKKRQQLVRKGQKLTEEVRKFNLPFGTIISIVVGLSVAMIVISVTTKVLSETTNINTTDISGRIGSALSWIPILIILAIATSIVSVIRRL